MSLAKLVSVAVAACALSTIVGCAATSEETALSEGAVKSTTIEAGSFRLYSEAHPAPNPMCDVHTQLTLSGERGGLAKLHEAVDGVCDLFVEPNEREYLIRLTGDDCGSKIYTGSAVRNGQTFEVSITDHRSRLCRDLVPAMIVLDETDAKLQKSQRRFSFDGEGREGPVSHWLTISPKQCGENPWENTLPKTDEPSWLGHEEREVAAFFAKEGITIDQIGFANPTEPRVTCSSCSCPRGDTLIVHVTADSDARTLATQHGFAPVENAFSRAPIQCGGNPWEKLEGSASEADKLATWASSIGAPLAEVAFVDHVEPIAVCMACQCARGDLAVVFPKNAAARSRLETLGWAQVN